MDRAYGQIRARAIGTGYAYLGVSTAYLCGVKNQGIYLSR